MTEAANQIRSGRLAEIYSPCFTLILQLRSSSHFSDAETLRSNLLQVLNECEQNARRSGSVQDAEDAKFALVAFVDETVLSSDWSMKSVWMSKPLQLQLYSRFDAGEQFFERMEPILQNPSRLEVLEVYYLCLTLGFKGRYQLVEQDKLRARIDAARNALKQSPEMRPGDLSPNGRPRDQIATEVKSKLPTWAIVAATVTIALLIYFVMSIYVSQKAKSVRSALEELATIQWFNEDAPLASLNATPARIDA